jgi:succinoglycan biosynthesis protein ExoA
MMDDSNLPMVSVILPIRNERRYIACSLGSVLAQQYPAGRMEILVIDGMSEDGTREVAQQLASQQSKFPVRILDNPKLITSIALNIGVFRARGEIIVRVDGHCEIKPDYVRCCVEYLQQGTAEGVGGTIVTLGDTNKGRAIALGTSSAFGVGNSLFRLKKRTRQFTDSVPFPAYKREIFNRAGYYDEEMLCNEDDEFNYRLRKMGGRLLLAEDVSSHYYCRSSLKGLWKQHFRYGLWKIRVLQKHPGQMSLRQFVPPVLVLALIGSACLALFPASRILSLFIPLTYLSANLLASVYTGIKYGRRTLPFLPFVFACIHLSYGLGFLYGLAKFGRRWGDKQVKTPVYQSKYVEMN